jgi:hypothetical protein
MLRTALAACLLAVLLGAPAAFADSTRTKILQECQDGRLTGSYTSAQIRDALEHIPDDVDQYSDCRDVLRRALLSQASNSGNNDGNNNGGGGGGAGASGGGPTAGGSGGEPLTPSTDADRKALDEAAGSGGQPIQIAGRNVTPGEGNLRNSLPTTLLVVLALLAVAAVAALAPPVKRHAQQPLTALRRVLPGRSG